MQKSLIFSSQIYQFLLLWLLNFISYLEKYSLLWDYNKTTSCFLWYFVVSLFHIKSLIWNLLWIKQDSTFFHIVTQAPQHLLNPFSHHKKSIDPNKSSSVVKRFVTFPFVKQLSLVRIQNLSEGIKLASNTLADWALLQGTESSVSIKHISSWGNWLDSSHHSWSRS